MPMIQGIDGSVLLNAFRQGRADRREEAEREAEVQRKAQMQGLMGQLFPQDTAGGVEGQYAPSQPAPAQPTTFGEAFNPQTMEAFGRGEDPAQAPAAPAGPSYRGGPRRPDPNVLAQLIVLDPETGGRIATALKSMDEANLARIEAKNSHMGAAARYVQQGRTPEERMQRFQIAAPSLIEAGFTPEELDGIDNDLSDERLQFYQATAIDYDSMIDNEMAEREFNAGKTVPVTAGGNVALVKPDGSARWVIGGGPEGGAPQVPEAAIAELRQNPATAAQFDEIFGAGAAARILEGGPTGSAPSGGF